VAVGRFDLLASVFNTLLYTTIASAINSRRLICAAAERKHAVQGDAARAGADPLHRADVLSRWRSGGSSIRNSRSSPGRSALGLITQNINFLATSLGADMRDLRNIWRGVPFVAITLLAGLQTVQPSLYEPRRSTRSKWEMFRFITYPLLTPIIAVVMTFSCCSPSRLPADLGDDARRPSTQRI